MNIGIIVHSQTGNTLSVVQKLEAKLLAAGHSVNIERIMPNDEKQADIKKVKLERIPDINAYDALIIGGPVHAFSISNVLAAFLSTISSFQNKKVGILVTHQFPFAVLGGSQTVAKIGNICKSKNAVVCGEGIVNWSSKKREKTIEEVVTKFVSLF